MKRKHVAVAALFVSRNLKVIIYAVPVVIKTVPYGVVAACMN